MNKKGYWIQKETFFANRAIVIHEVKCPFCKHCETFDRTKTPPKNCYVCNAELKIKD